MPAGGQYPVHGFYLIGASGAINGRTMKVHNVKIKNFMAFTDSNFKFPQEGIHNLQGRNLDVLQGGEPTSNGSGKSSLLLAVTMGLFNKVPGARIEQLNSLTTRRPFHITVDFEAKGGTYRVINDRSKLNMELYDLESGELIAAKIREVLTTIESLIGLTYKQFIAITFITPTTLVSLFTSDKSLIAQHYQLDKLDGIIAKLKEKRRLAKSEMRVVDARIQEAKSTTIGNFSVTDINTEIETLRAQLVALEDHEYKLQGEKLARNIAGSGKRLTYFEQLLHTLSQNDQLLGLDTCPTCGQKVETDSTERNRDQKLLAKGEIVELKATIREQNATLRKLREDYEVKYTSLSNQLKVSESKLITLEHIESTNSVNINALVQELKSITAHADLIGDLIKYINGGTLVLAHMQSFLLQLEDSLEKQTVAIGYPLRIKPVIDRVALSYEVRNADDQLVDISLLSGGELTTAALLVLYAFAEALYSNFGIQLPFIVLDEVFSRIDEVNIKPLTELVRKFQEITTVIVVQHHKELPDSIFDGDIVVQKLLGVAEVV